MTKVLILDNYDSFTYNLVQYLGELGAEVEAVRNDAAGVDELLEDLRAAMARGELPPLDAEYMARAMAGAGLEIAMEMFERPGKPDVQGATAFATDLFLGGIGRMGRRSLGV